MTVTPFYAALLVAIYMVLSVRIIRARRAQRIDLGDGDDPLMRRRIRGHANFAEYVPLGLVLMMLLELGGWPAWVLHGMGVLLVAGRLAHAWAFSVARFRGPGRVAGTALTLTTLGVAAILCAAQALR